MSVRSQLRRLETLRDKCGAGEKERKPDVDLSKMSEYERHQYRLAEQMQRIRGNVLELDNLPESATATQKGELRNNIRKDVMALERNANEARRWAKEENRREEYERLITHVRRTQGLWNDRFQTNSNVDPALMSPSAAPQQLDREMSALSAPMVNLHDDQEFALFFEQASRRDEEIDQALDQVSAGVQVLHQQAKQINTELKVQKELLAQAEQKMDDVTGSLKGLNKKLKKTIKEVEKDRLCLYVTCCLLLLALAGTIYFVAIKGKSNKSE